MTKDIVQWLVYLFKGECYLLNQTQFIEEYGAIVTVAHGNKT